MATVRILMGRVGGGGGDGGRDLPANVDLGLIYAQRCAHIRQLLDRWCKRPGGVRAGGRWVWMGSR